MRLDLGIIIKLYEISNLGIQLIAKSMRPLMPAVSLLGILMRYQGKIDSWKDDRGFGFITQKSDGSRVFAHISSFLNRQRRPVGNETVSYDLKTDTNGRLQAVKIAFSDESLSIVSPTSRIKFSLIFTFAFVVFISTATLIGRLPLIVLGIYLAVSTIAFIAYAFDKSAAKNDRWRIQESTFHLFALIGGWPGALVAQRVFRHKSKKNSFQIVYWITVVINCCVLGYLFTPAGEELFRSILLGIGG